LKNFVLPLGWDNYFISSDLMEPPNSADHYAERVLPNSSIYFVDQPSQFILQFDKNGD
jgi:hypothetical protein